MPLNWIEKTEKGPISFSFIIEKLSDVETVHQYIQGKVNTIPDACSRYPMLGGEAVGDPGIYKLSRANPDALTDQLPGGDVSTLSWEEEQRGITSAFVQLGEESQWPAASNPPQTLAPSESRLRHSHPPLRDHPVASHVTGWVGGV
jgi:hypothetical protein